jgi:hypothetical protein
MIKRENETEAVRSCPGNVNYRRTEYFARFTLFCLSSDKKERKKHFLRRNFLLGARVAFTFKMATLLPVAPCFQQQL